MKAFKCTTLLALQLIVGMFGGYFANKIKWVAVAWAEIPFVLRYPEALDSDVGYNYICRSKWNGAYYSGKLYVSFFRQPSCLFGLDGREIYGNDFEFLIYPPGTVSWEEYKGSLPANAIYAGNNREGIRTYVCRGLLPHNRLILDSGYFTKQTGRCFVGNHKEYVLAPDSFEIMVKNQYGVLINA